MSQWKNNLKAEDIGRWEHKTLEDLTLIDDVQGEITVPAGFVTNYASLDSLRNIFLFPLYALVAGYGNKSATVHDMLYTEAKLSRKECDQVFYRGLRAEGIARWRASIFYAGVRVGGAGHYGVA